MMLRESEFQWRGPETERIPSNVVSGDVEELVLVEQHSCLSTEQIEDDFSLMQHVHICLRLVLSVFMQGYDYRENEHRLRERGVRCIEV